MQNPSYQPDFRRNPNITGSHEEYWTIYPRSQWNSNCTWNYLNKNNENKIHEAAMHIRRIGRNCNLPPRLIHYTQLLIWRFYAKESIDQHPIGVFISLAFECASQFIEYDDSHNLLSKIREDKEIQRLSVPYSGEKSQLVLHFQFVTSLDYTVRIHHPSEYLPMFISVNCPPDKKMNLISIAEKIIADSFLSPCCLVHRPSAIAEGAMIMSAAMQELSAYINVRSTKALSFIADISNFYKPKQELDWTCL